jgi:hypothetical protein
MGRTGAKGGTVVFGVTIGALLSTSVAEAAAASAQPLPSERADPSGFELGVRMGYSRPMGGIAQDTSLSDIVSSRFPLWLDVGYRIDPHWYVGAYFQYGFMTMPSGYCTKCSAHDVTAGVGATYHLAPHAFIDPWLGIGVGYEIVSATENTFGNSMSFSGFQLCNVQAGADYYLSHLALGPFVSLSVARYSTSTLTVFPDPALGGDGQISTAEGVIRGQAFHEWLTIGFRGTYDVVFPL